MTAKWLNLERPRVSLEDARITQLSWSRRTLGAPASKPVRVLCPAFLSSESFSVTFCNCRRSSHSTYQNCYNRRPGFLRSGSCCLEQSSNGVSGQYPPDNTPGQYPPGQHPPGQHPPGQYPPWTISPLDNIPLDSTPSVRVRIRVLVRLGLELGFRVRVRIRVRVGGTFKGGYCPGGYCPGGILSGGILSGGMLSGGCCPGDIVRGDIVRGDIVLEPSNGP